MFSREQSDSWSFRFDVVVHYSSEFMYMLNSNGHTFVVRHWKQSVRVFVLAKQKTSFQNWSYTIPESLYRIIKL